MLVTDINKISEISRNLTDEEINDGKTLIRLQGQLREECRKYKVNNLGQISLGLSAIQIGIPVCVSYINLKTNKFLVINPKVKLKGKIVIEEEGCCSLPDVKMNVPRHSECTLYYTDFKGNKVECECEGILCRVVLHEIDHGQGRTILDYQ